MTARVKSIIALAVILLSLGSLYFTWLPRPPAPDPRPHESLGYTLGVQTARAVASGGRITLIAPDTVMYPNPAIDAQIESFDRELKKRQLHITATNRIKLDPLRLVRVPARDFFELIRKQTERDVIVSLMGPPLPNADQRARLPEKRPTIIAVCSGDTPRQIPLKRLFEMGVLHVGIISRPSPSASVAGESPEAWFDNFFQVITPANLGDLPPADPLVPAL